MALPLVRIYINIIVTQMIQYLLVLSSNCQQLFPNFTIYNKTSNKEIPVDNTTTPHYLPLLSISYKFTYTLEKF